MNEKTFFNSEEIDKEHDKAAEMRIYLEEIKFFINEVKQNHPYGFLRQNNWEKSLNNALDMLKYLSGNNQHDLETLKGIEREVKEMIPRAKELIKKYPPKK